MSQKHKYNNVSFNTYIYRILKQVHPDSGMSGDGLSEMNNLVRIFLKKIVDGMNLLFIASKAKTVSARDVQSAVRLVLPGELAKHAVSEGVKAVTKYNSGGGAPGGGGRGGRAKPVSRGTRAGLMFPVTRVETVMMELVTVRRKSAGSAVYLAAVLEYLTAEILELSGNAARDNKKMRITPRHMKLAILNDEELTKLCKGIVMTGGVLPHINAKLLPKEKKVRDEDSSPKKTKKPQKKSKKAKK